MFKELRFSILTVALLLLSGVCYADIVSLQSNFVAGEATVVDHLNNDRTALTNGVNNIRGVYAGGVQSSGQIKADTIGEENCYDDMNPRIRTYEGASCEKVVSGMLPTTTSGTLTGSVPAGTAYPRGYRVYKASDTAHNFGASKWTWVDVKQDGTFTFLEQAIGSAAPAVTTNSIRLALVSTDATEVTYVNDLRTTNCANAPFSNFANATGEADLADILVSGDGGVIRGLNIIPNDNTSVYLKSGAAYINGYYRNNTANLQVPIDSNGNSLTGVSGLDAGAVGANTTYYLYGTADIAGTKPVVAIFSSNINTPAGPTNYRKLGYITTDGASTFASQDFVSINYNGKIRQIKSWYTGEVATGTGDIPNDDTVPQITEGTEYFTIKMSPTVSTNKLLFLVDVMVSNETGSVPITIGLFKDSDASALAANQIVMTATTQYPVCLNLSYVMTAGTTAETTFRVRMGSTGSSRLTMNGFNTARKLGGVQRSGLTVIEYEP